jgi:hypothetical protein
MLFNTGGVIANIIEQANCWRYRCIAIGCFIFAKGCYMSLQPRFLLAGDSPRSEPAAFSSQDR